MPRLIPRMPDNPDRIVSLQDAARHLGISERSLRRNYKQLFIRVTPNRVGMRFSDISQIIKKGDPQGK